ncbi:PAS domain-containing sensor histidine kinase [Mucilaginibacter auburnensis]|uniref:histidine kinase n=1 Tax=Mucilaginibacter auburnensis TaxID=1457233 RepID=A0A2H9VVZ8_9SPHI|nr:ATP-binding protein [Mucilaginibacter auburnensis]PJJ84998.1 two-component system sensor histidine kinase VicK [Mucilaginibacter auburnensis]
MDDIQSLQHTIQQLRLEIEHLKSEEHRAAILSTDQRYQESQVRFRTVFEASRLGNKIIASDLKILQVNQAMVTLLGFETKEELIGAVILDFAPEERHSDWHFLQEKLWQEMSPSFSFETCLQKKDGSKVWCQITSILFPDNGQTLGYTIIEDITERYNLREQREEFISIASHELKTPITSLQATIQIIHKMVTEGAVVTDSLKKFAGNARRYTTKINHLVEDLLNMTKIEQGQLALNKNIFALSELIDGCCDHIDAGGRHCLRYTGDHSLKVTADQNKIEQVVVNFVNNAAKYAPESYEIVIDVKRTLNCTKVSVIDKGKGIPPSSISKLFERYYRDEGNKEQVAGLGLGLYVSSEIIKRHGGEIGVESQPGIGSTFWFTLPDVNMLS